MNKNLNAVVSIVAALPGSVCRELVLAQYSPVVYNCTLQVRTDVETLNKYIVLYPENYHQVSGERVQEGHQVPHHVSDGDV